MSSATATGCARALPWPAQKTRPLCRLVGLAKPSSKLLQFPSAQALAARDALVLAHLPLVDLVAKSKTRKLPPCFEFDDLRGVGYVALIHAAEDFDPSLEVPFDKYASRQ